MYRSVFLLGFVLTLAWCSGCADPPMKAPPPTGVKGTVNLDGKAMASGEIRFGVPGFPAKIMEIKDGKFSGEAAIGNNQVEVVQMKDEGFTTTEPKTPIKVNLVAEQFSGPNTTLKADVVKDGANEFKFDVTSK